MIGARTPVIRAQTLVSIVFLIFAVLGAWEVGNWISNGDLSALAYATIVGVVCAIGITILRDWRLGFYSFLVWLLFEDLVRKFAGNNMLIYFAKDVLATLTFFSLMVMVRRRREFLFRPPSLSGSASSSC